jgi:hypothetical protein
VHTPRTPHSRAVRAARLHPWRGRPMKRPSSRPATIGVARKLAEDQQQGEVPGRCSTACVPGTIKKSIGVFAYSCRRIGGLRSFRSLPRQRMALRHTPTGSRRASSALQQFFTPIGFRRLNPPPRVRPSRAGALGPHQVPRGPCRGRRREPVLDEIRWAGLRVLHVVTPYTRTFPNFNLRSIWPKGG